MSLEELAAGAVTNDAINPASAWLRAYMVACLRKKTALEEAYGWWGGWCLVGGSLSMWWRR